MGCNFTKAVRRFYPDTWGRCLGGRWGGGRISRGVICNSTFLSLSGGVPPPAGGRCPGPGWRRPGARAAWCSSGLVLERPGARAAWCSSGLVLRRPGAPPAWCSAGLVLRRPGAPPAWCSSWCRPGAPPAWCSAGLALELLRRPGARAAPRPGARAAPRPGPPRPGPPRAVQGPAVRGGYSARRARARIFRGRRGSRPIRYGPSSLVDLAVSSSRPIGKAPRAVELEGPGRPGRPGRLAAGRVGAPLDHGGDAVAGSRAPCARPQLAVGAGLEEHSFGLP
jgi:hypothetical protein